MKYMKDFVARFSKRNVFSLRDARVFLKQKKISKGYLHFLIHCLLKKGALRRITGGVYTFSDDPMVIGFAFAPFYYGLQEALSLHGLWEQETNPVIVTPRKVRTGVRQAIGANYWVRHVNPKMFFGYALVQHYGQWLPVSTIEKTLIDFAYFNEKIPPNALKAIKERLDRKALEAFLKKAPTRVQKRVRTLLGDRVPRSLA